jgi:hypothetical protein
MLAGLLGVRAAGFRYQLSILQAEFARTEVFDRPLSGRHLFEQVIRENLDRGRPEKVSLIFQRRITKRTPSRFRTRILTQGVIPTLHVSYKSSKIKQYSNSIRPCAQRPPSTTLATSASDEH